MRISGHNQNDAVLGADIDEQMGRAYDVATLRMSRRPFDMERVAIEYGSKQFNGFVYRTEADGDAWRVECRSDTARLTTPFSLDMATVENYSTASDLLAHYAAETGISIDYRCADLDFGRAFERDGTMLDGIEQIVSVAAAEMYVRDSSTLVIRPHIGLSGNSARVIYDRDIIGDAEMTMDSENASVGIVEISDSDGADTADQQTAVEVDNCTGDITIYPVPFDGVSASAGMSPLAADEKTLHESFTIVDATYVQLKCEAAEVRSVRVNGAEAAYTATGNIVEFPVVRSGFVDVEYIGRVYRSRVHGKITPNGIYWRIDIDHNGQISTEQGMIDIDCAQIGADRIGLIIPACGGGVDDEMSVFAPGMMNYVKGFDLWISGGSPVFRFFVDGDELMISPTPHAETMTLRIRPELSYYTSAPSDTATRCRIPRPGFVVRDVYASDSDDPVWSVDGEYVLFDRMYRNVEIVYELQAVRYHIEREDLGADVTMKLANVITPAADCEWMEWTLRGYDKYDLSTYPCVLPASLPVDIYGSLSVPLNSLVGQSVKVTTADDGTVQYCTIDERGFAFVSVSHNTEYVIDVSRFESGKSLVLIVKIGE